MGATDLSFLRKRVASSRSRSTPGNGKSVATNRSKGALPVLKKNNIVFKGVAWIISAVGDLASAVIALVCFGFGMLLSVRYGATGFAVADGMSNPDHLRFAGIAFSTFTGGFAMMAMHWLARADDRRAAMKSWWTVLLLGLTFIDGITAMMGFTYKRYPQLADHVFVSSGPFGYKALAIAMFCVTPATCLFYVFVGRMLVDVLEGEADDEGQTSQTNASAQPARESGVVRPLAAAGGFSGSQGANPMADNG